MDQDGLDLTRFRQILAGELGRIGGGLIPANEPVVGDLAEAASTDTDNGISMAVAEIKTKKRVKIVAALNRIRVGTFGICMDCRGPISRVRLESAPWEPCCRYCEEKRSQYSQSGRRNSVGCYVQVRA